MGFLEKWRQSRDVDWFRSEFDDLLERFGLDRDWFRFPTGREFFADREARPKRPLARESQRQAASGKRAEVTENAVAKTLAACVNLAFRKN